MASDLNAEHSFESSQSSDNLEASKLMNIFRPVLYSLEENVARVANSQVELRSELDALLVALRQVKVKLEEDSLTATLEEKSKKLVALKRRLTLVHTILQNSNERCRKLMMNHKLQPIQQSSS
ncbi:SNARE-associated protein Snapin [Halotydeus destructor]|nr:SNARE-associated protein Snapin [Halotydeus destructor]